MLERETSYKRTRLREKKKENSTRERRGRSGGEEEAKNSVFKAANQRPFYENRVRADATGSNAA